MIDISQYTVVIPFKYDTDDRIVNINAVLRYFKSYFINHDIIIIEQGEKSNKDKLQLFGEVSYEFVQDAGFFWKTKLLNIGLSKCKRPFYALHDADVVFRPEAYSIATTLLNIHPFIYPFNGVFWNLQGGLRDRILETFDFNTLVYRESARLYDTFGGAAMCIHYASPGGAAFFNVDILKRVGAFNENFHCWGYEDDEIAKRFGIMGYPPIRLNQFNMYHFNHARTNNSDEGHPFIQKNKDEYNKVISMSQEQLRVYIASGMK